MTDFQTKPDAMDIAIFLALSAKEWRTAVEVWSRCPGYRLQDIRHRLRTMAEQEDIRDSIAGDPGRPVREYKSWK